MSVYPRCLATLAGAIVLALSGARLQAETPPRPNIILIVVDDLGYGELGCQGNTDIPTPRIDSLASGGARFTNAYVTAPVCAPSRAGLITGRYQNQFGFLFNPIGPENDDPRVGLPATELTLPLVLQQAGYATALIGKWHLGGTAEYHPLRRGFDEFFGFLHEGHSYAPPPAVGMVSFLRRKSLPDGGQGLWMTPDGRLILSTHMGHQEPPYDANNPLLRNGQPAAADGYLTQVWSEAGLDFIHRHAHRPFFLYLAYNAVHSPMQAPEESVRAFSRIEDVHRRVFAGMLSELDQGIGQMLDALSRLGLAERTLVFLISDNGGPTRELTSSNHPLRGGKGTLYEGGIRVPFLMQWLGRIPAGLVVPEPVSSLDIFPTCLAAAGIVRSDLQNRLEGVSLLPRVSQTASAQLPEREFFWHYGQKGAIRVGRWKLLMSLQRNGPGAPELFDLSEDLSEQTNLATAHPDQVQELEARWQDWQKRFPPPLWTPRGY